jgi:pyruvate,water dikinase
VPDGFALPTVVCSEFIGPLHPQLLSLLDFSGSDFGELQRRCQEARDLVEHRPYPLDLEEHIVKAVEELARRTELGASLSTAVRSSGVLEDLEQASFAGQYDTYLGMRSAAEVLDSVRKCWASQYTARAVEYRRHHGLPVMPPGIAVGVMQLVRSRAAGVTFTLNPLTGDTEHAVVEASWGFGESVVSGLVTPDHYVVRKSDGQIVLERIAAKKVWSVFGAEWGRVTEQPCPPDLRRRPCLSHAEVRHIVQIAAGIECHEGQPQDVEWAIDEGLPFPDNVFLLQHRPVTTVKGRARRN